MELKGIDVSSYQGDINWKTVADYGMDFAILRITEAGNKIDNKFERNYKGCVDNHIPVGVYKYSYASTVAEAVNEAERVVSVLNGRKLDYPVWLDLEWNNQRYLGAESIHNLADAFSKVIEEAGYAFGIYCNVDWYVNVICSHLKKYDFWIARYPASDNGTLQERLRPSYGQLWQYSSKATIPGIPTKVDRNVCYKDYAKGGDKNMTKEQMIQNIINDAVDYAVRIANDNSHGYSQAVRSLYNITTPKSYDCSSLVCTSFYYAFIKNGLNEQAEYLKKNCSYTGNMLKMLNCGFEIVATKQTAHAKMQKGDIELNTTYHTALAVDKNNIVHARTSEGTTDTKDNSGNEIRVQPWYLYSHGWTHRLRFTGKGINLSNISNNISATSKSYLSKGDKGSEVKSLQHKLNLLGYKGKNGKSIAENGNFGTHTDYAVRAFQKAQNLEIDGKVGKLTLAALDAVVKANTKPQGNQNVRDAQTHLNNFVGSNLQITGKVDSVTKKSFRKAVQIALNKDYNARLTVNGKIGIKTKLALKKVALKKGSKGYLVTVLEIGMLMNNINPSGVECPGSFGSGLFASVKKYQGKKSLEIDGIAGYATFTALMK